MAATACLLLPSIALATPFIEVGDSQLRSDIQILADAGVITGPVSTWPLAWGDVASDLTVAEELRPFEMAALARVRAEASEQMRTGDLEVSARLSAAANPIEIRGFEDTAREDGEVEIGASWTGEFLAVNLEGSWVADASDDREWRADGTYLGISLGNWSLTGSVQDRWWGPGWQSSLIMSNNARPIPSIVIDRNSTAAFKTKWLSWLGPWDLNVLYGWLESDRAVPNTHFFAARFTFKPFKSLELGLSRSAQLCGDDRPCDGEVHKDMLFGEDNRGDNVSREDEPGNQLAGYDARWSVNAFNTPMAFYSQWIGEDEGGGLPAKFLGQFGAETWGQLGDIGTYRVYLEWVDTECNFELYKGSEGTVPDCAYNHPIYESGYRRYKRSIGSTFDNDARVWTLGGMLTDNRDNDWSFRLGYGDLNRETDFGDPIPPEFDNQVAPVKTRYREIEFGHKRKIFFGDIRLTLGYDYRKDTRNNKTDDNVRASLDWTFPIYN